VSALFSVQILALRPGAGTTTVELLAEQIHPEGTDLSNFEAGVPPPDLPFATRLVGRMLGDATRSNAIRSRIEQLRDEEDPTLPFIEHVDVLESQHLCVADYLDQPRTLAEIRARFGLDPEWINLLRHVDHLRALGEDQREAFAEEHGVDPWSLGDDQLDYVHKMLDGRGYELWRSSVTLVATLPSELTTHLETGMAYRTTAYGG
jgi:hypothetical protein